MTQEIRKLTWCISFVSLLFVGFPESGVCGEGRTRQAEPVISTDAHISSLPPFEFDIEDGLYATLTAFSNIEQIQEGKFKDGNGLRKDSEVKLKNIEGFKKDFKVLATWQSQKREAPLAVLLLGLATRADSALARFWKTQMYEAGCHVVTFDSPFLPTFSERSRHGVAGNVQEEALLVARVIEAFMKHKSAKGRISKVGLIGGSYGGVLALHVAQIVEKRQIELPLEATMVFSPPVNMETAAKLLDKYHREDRWRYTLMELGSEMLGHKRVSPGEPIPFSKSEMRAGIAAAFRMDLEYVVEKNDRIYKMGLLPSLDEDEFDDQYRKDVAETWTFEKFVEVMSYSYWSKKGKASSPEELWAAGRLDEIFQDCPQNVQVIMTRDDPLNDPDELMALESSAPRGVLTVLPRGGHLGYLNTEWAKAKLHSLFK